MVCCNDLVPQPQKWRYEAALGMMQVDQVVFPFKKHKQRTPEVVKERIDFWIFVGGKNDLGNTLYSWVFCVGCSRKHFEFKVFSKVIDQIFADSSRPSCSWDTLKANDRNPFFQFDSIMSLYAIPIFSTVKLLSTIFRLREPIFSK